MMESRKHHRRKSQSSIRSPLIKRDLQSQVTMEGWLYKLEGGALKQWKRRWFVLADFCLFYYKGPEEEKILGSILLPSYKINPCTSDDKISRKFAFKAEHHNMKTYYFAADSTETMRDWMNAMSLASIMQKVSRHEMMRTKTSLNQAPNDDDSGFTSYRSRRYGMQDPNSTLDSSFASDHLLYQSDNFSDGIADVAFLGSDDKYPSNYGGSPTRSYVVSPHKIDGAQRRQPLYANAPPKPRRLGQSDPYTISPSEQYGSPVYGYSDNLLQSYSPEDSSQTPVSSDYTVGLGQYGLYPDQNSIPSGHKLSNQDLYADKYLSSRHYHAQVYREGHTFPNTHLSKKTAKSQPPRPHSADFLERDTEYNPAFHDVEEKSHQPPRPKSSLECYDSRQYWGQEEWYGDDRQCQQNSETQQISYSVTPDNFDNSSLPADERYLQQKLQSASSTWDTCMHPENKYYIREHESSPVRHSASATHLKETYWPNKMDQPQHHIHWGERKPVLRHSVDNTAQERRRPVSEGYEIGESLQIPNGISDSKKAQLREESLKRLLEWKQRMLQSPLTKKAAHKSAPGSRNSSPGTPPVRPPLPEEYRQKVLQELESHEARLRNHELEIKDTYEISKTKSPVTNNLTESGMNNYEIHLPYEFHFRNNHLKQEDDDHKRYTKISHPEISSEEGISVHHLIKDENQKSTAKSAAKSQEMRRSSSSLNRMTHSYSSDDEDIIVKERRRIRRPSQGSRVRKASVDPTMENKKGKHTTSPSSSPDYVNINALNETLEHGFNKCDRVMIKSLPAEEDLSAISASADNFRNEVYAQARKQETKGSLEKVVICEETSFLGSIQSCSYNTEKSESSSIGKNSQDSGQEHLEDDKKEDFYIGRDDYFKASQLFYCISQNKIDNNEKFVNKDKQNTSHFSNKTDIFSSEEGCLEESYDSRYRKNVVKPSASDWELDKDVGLPLPHHPSNICKDKNKNSEDDDNIKKEETNLPNSVEITDTLTTKDIASENFQDENSKVKELIPDHSCEFKNEITFDNEEVYHRTPVKNNLSFEERRMILQRQREAPPPNIVQERIKHFELAKSDVTSTEDAKKVYSSLIKSESHIKSDTQYTDFALNLDDRSDSNYTDISGKSDIQQFAWDPKDLIQYEICKPQISGDSDATVLSKHPIDSVPNEDLIALKSEPILLSPLSTVLADLRRTADTGKEKKQFKEDSLVDEVIITKGALRLSMVASHLDKEKLSLNDMLDNQHAVKKSSLEEEEEAYLPMSGKKNIEEPEYVAMDDSCSKGISSHSSVYNHLSDKETVLNEPLYNEPFSAPPSFLHDVYGKQRSKHLEFDSSSSEELSSENIYEKPKHSTVYESLKRQKEKCDSESYQHSSNELLKHSSTQLQQIENSEKMSEQVKVTKCNVISSPDSNKLFRKTCTEKYEGMTCKPPQLDDSIPDLLQLEEVKDSDASDADDEASRDFDTPRSLNLPSYQTAILLGENCADDQHHPSSSEDRLPSIPPSYTNKYLKERCSSSVALFTSVEGDNHSHLYESGSSYGFSYGQKSGLDTAQTSLKHDSSVTLHAHEISNSFTDFNCNQNFEKYQLPSQLKPAFRQNIKNLSDEKMDNILNVSISSKEEVAIQTSTDHMNSKENLQLPLTSVGSRQTSDLLFQNFNLSDSSPSTVRLSPSHLKSSSDSSSRSLLHMAPAPDVVPADAREDIPTIKKTACKIRRSPNTAPYYYSDLLPDDDTESGKCENFKFVPSSSEKQCSPKVKCAVLNNVRDVTASYSYRGDIGRKVNKIHDRNELKSSRMQEAQSFNHLSSKGPGYEISESVAKDLKSSLEKFLCPESKKFLDAEKNKYEAGHTLEKTRRTSSTLVHLKHRASTPDFDCPQKQSEPQYENLHCGPQLHSLLPRRLSRSMEGLLEFRDCNMEVDPATKNDHETLLNTEEPFYENVEFVRHIERNKAISCNLIDDTNNDESMPHVHPANCSFLDGNFLLHPPDKCNQTRKDVLSNSVTEQISVGQSSCSPLPVTSKERMPCHEESDTDLHYLDQHVLRRVSERHFLGRYMSGKLIHRQNSWQSTKVCSREHPFLGQSQKSDFDGGGGEVILEKSSSSQELNQEESSISGIASMTPKHLENWESGSSSSSSSSSSSTVDPKESFPNREKDGKKHSRGHCKPMMEDSNMSDSEIHVREPCRLRKLVQQSEGLTFRGKRLSISAGDLLGKTHEELVLLLIQLRRNQSRIIKAKEKCCLQLEKEQQNASLDSEWEQEHIHNCNELKHQITELERQHQMTQPLVSLVDNMVKLGSLYGGGGERRSSSFSKLNMPIPSDEITCPSDGKVEFTHHSHDILRSQEGLHWNNDGLAWSTKEERDLQECLRQLCHLDRSLHEESLTFCCLLQDKHILEQTLSGVHSKIQDYQDNPVDVQKLKKQQRMIEKELSRVTRFLSQSAQKMEETAAENAKLEQEVLVLRQKIQEVLSITSHQKESSSQSRSELEAELSCVQKVIEELADHRREISRAVEKLKLESNQKSPSVMTGVRASPTGVVGSAPLPLRKKHQSSYLETDLDTMETHDLSATVLGSSFDIPLYVNAEEINTVSTDCVSERDQLDSLPPLIPSNAENISLDSILDVTGQYLPQDINEADDRMKRFYGILPREKPSEIKTVRIVKRESERRNRVKDKKKVTYDEQSLVWVVEEPEINVDDTVEDEDVTNFKRTMSLPLSSIHATNLFPFTSYKPQGQSAHERLFGSTSHNREASESIHESSPEENNSSKRPKRRHYTISGFQSWQDHKMIKGGLRSRDDLDMEHCLRTANTPDIVRSTIKKSEIYDEKIIDRELNLPQKILIPERYIEDEPEQLTATERLRRSLKAETIRKMLSQTTTFEDIADREGEPSDTLKKKLDEEKRRRAHLLALNHALAKEVMEKSKIVAASLSSPDHT